MNFTGLAPLKGITAQDQRNAFGGQLAQNLGTPSFTFRDWGDAFLHIWHHLDKDVPTVILFDEISWIGSKDMTFLPKLKA